MDEDIADLENLDIEENSGDEEVQLTAAKVIELMEEAWLNEKFAPEILPNKIEIVDCLLGQINYMEDNLQNYESVDFKKGLHQLEVDRLRFLITSYLRTRLKKIERHVGHILKQEEERHNKEQELYLTGDELKFAQNYKEGLDEHFSKLLDFYPNDDWKENSVIPNLHSFVFLKSKSEVEGVKIDENNQEDDVVDLSNGSQLIISYTSISNLVKEGNVHLI